MILVSPCLTGFNYDYWCGLEAINSEKKRKLVFPIHPNMSSMYSNPHLHNSLSLVPSIPATPLRHPPQLSVSLKSRRYDLCLCIVKHSNYYYAWPTAAEAARLAKQDRLEKPRHSACSECVSEIKLKLVNLVTSALWVTMFEKRVTLM